MTRFNVLDRRQDIQRHYLLEASAGTGKTFSIENIVVRLLIEGEFPKTIEKILVVTFTKAATRDLRVRVRANIEKAIHQLSSASDEAPDYLLYFMEQGNAIAHLAIKRLQDALFCFDQAQIFTIHSFCSRMLRDNVLEGDFSVGSNDTETLSESLLNRVVHDFFRTGIRQDRYCQEQLKIVLKKHESDIEKLKGALLREIKKGIEIEEQTDFATSLTNFSKAMSDLSCCGYTPELIIEDFIKQAPSYKQLCDRKRVVKPDVLEKVQSFVDLLALQQWHEHEFTKVITEGVFIAEAINDSMLTEKGKPIPEGQLHYPTFITKLQQTLVPIVEEARSPISIFAKMAYDCQQLAKKTLEAEEKVRFDDILKAMWKACQQEAFRIAIQKQYKAAIIDEFQDTDPLQWSIFEALFLKATKGWGCLYLVGDPKQSIYAFRQADIYTYLMAADAIGKENHASLDTNFRSQPHLVFALNALFAEKTTPGLMPLPRLNQTLPYTPVQAGAIERTKSFSDDFAAVHFCNATIEEKSRGFPLEKMEEEYFFPFFTKEILRLHEKDSIRFDQFAILVSDRYQANRLSAYFKRCQIPVILQRTHSLADSPALTVFEELLKAVINPKNRSALKKALGSKLIGWTHEEVRQLEGSDLYEKVLIQFFQLKGELLNCGIANFYQRFLKSSWFKSPLKVMERLLSEDGGIDFYNEFQQIATLLIEEENKNNCSADDLIAFLNQFSTLQSENEDRFKSKSDPCRNGVQVMTMHSSKGLEFDIVFALGLVRRTQQPNQLVPRETKEGYKLCVVHDVQDELYKKYCEESDAEKMRQLYVAMTRPRYRLYLPVIQGAGKPPGDGTASPMELFLSRLNQPKAQASELYQRIASDHGEALSQFLQHLPAEVSITQGILHASKENLVFEAHQEKVELQSYKAPQIHGKQHYLLSFTSITKGQSYTEREDLKVVPPHNYATENKNIHTLPAGSDTGAILHKLLECIAFEKVKLLPNHEALEAQVKPFISYGSFDGWEKVLSEIIYNVLHAQLSIVDEGFCLADISANEKFQETEFLYPCEGMEKIEGLENNGGYLKGVIDLVFSYKGKYYIVDWKSNWLGDKTTDYGQDVLEMAMQEHHYYLQASIYKEALRKYLKVVDNRPFDGIFAGIFYIFLRGIDPDVPGNGIYYFNL